MIPCRGYWSLRSRSLPCVCNGDHWIPFLWYDFLLAWSVYCALSCMIYCCVFSFFFCYFNQCGFSERSYKFFMLYSSPVQCYLVMWRAKKHISIPRNGVCLFCPRFPSLCEANILGVRSYTYGLSYDLACLCWASQKKLHIFFLRYCQFAYLNITRNTYTFDKLKSIERLWQRTDDSSNFMAMFASHSSVFVSRHGRFSAFKGNN